MVHVSWNHITKPAIMYDDQTLSSCTSSALLSQATDGIVLCNNGDICKQNDVIDTKNLSAVILTAEDPDVIDLLNVSCPSIVIRPEDVTMVITYAKSVDMPRASMVFKQTFIGMKPAPTVASYASRGPLQYFQNILKPDIMARGSLVLAASIQTSTTAAQTVSKRLVNGAYNISSGTSFACPHVAGVAALLKSAHPEWSVAAVISAIMTTSNILDNNGHPIQEYRNRFQLASPLDMGAGNIDPNKALDPGLVYDATPQDYVNLICSVRSNKEKIKEITRSKNYSCSNPSADLNHPSLISSYSYRTLMKSINFQRTVTNVGEGATTYNAKVTYGA
jgi:subtilisin family serine protease